MLISLYIPSISLLLLDVSASKLTTNLIIIWLVVSTPLKNMSSSGWDDDIPNIWKVIKFHGCKPPTSLHLTYHMGISHQFNSLVVPKLFISHVAGKSPGKLLIFMDFHPMFDDTNGYIHIP